MATGKSSQGAKVSDIFESAKAREEGRLPGSVGLDPIREQRMAERRAKFGKLRALPGAHRNGRLNTLGDSSGSS